MGLQKIDFEENKFSERFGEKSIFFSLSLMCIKLQSKLKCTLVEIFHLLQQNTHSYKLQSQSVTAKHQYLGRVSVVSCIL